MNDDSRGPNALPSIGENPMWIAALAALVLASPVTATVIGEIDHVRRSGLYELPFELVEDATVRVRAVGAGPKENEPLLAYAWILDARTRQPAWTMTRENTSALRRGSEDREFDGEIDLEAGRYVAYFSALSRTYERRRGFKLLEKWIDVRSGGGFRVDWDDFGEPRRWGLWLEVAESADIARPWHGEIEDDAFLRFAPMGNHAFETAAFRVSRPVDVTIRCIAEYDAGDDSYLDRSWLANALTREVVWEPDPNDHDPAGGSPMNHAFDVRLELEPGDYVLSSSTDEGHSAASWIESAPHDPQGWGVLLDVDDRDAVKIVDDPRNAIVVCQIERVPTSTYERKAFTLERPLRVRIECTGERADRRMLDYGWLEQAPNSRVVWKMDPRRTEPAGGDRRNRVASETLELEAGTYIVSYLTDYGHAYGDWNGPAPNDPSAWGIRVFAATDEFDPGIVSQVDPRKADAALISLAPTGDKTHRKQLMTLPKAFELRIVCLGEGLSGRMYDYGWVENAETGRVVWEMEYDEARHAGGNAKNLYVDEIVRFEPGRYRVHYVTDSSHSISDWNAAPPDRPELWGISIYYQDNGPELARRIERH